MIHGPEDITMDSCLCLNGSMVLRVEGDEGAFLFDPATGAVSILNPTAVSIYRAVDGSRSVADIVAVLGGEYEGMDEAAAGQVLEAVRSLAEKDALFVVEG
jgi:hypothetical protein